MASSLPAAVEEMALRYAAQGRAEIERRKFRRNTRFVRSTRRLSRFIGAFAVGIFAAGLAVFCIVIVLNVIMQFAPSP
jgi:hypothetical protein